MVSATDPSATIAVLLVPVLVAVSNDLLFEFVVNLETWFPVTDADVIAAREAR